MISASLNYQIAVFRGTGKCVKFGCKLNIFMLANSSMNSRLPSRIITFTELKEHWRLFVLVFSFLVIFFVSGYVC